VFLINSRLSPFTATPSGFGREDLHPNGATLLPKLRVYFAEFLSESSLDRLRILSSPTCVGLRYGHPTVSLAAFPGSLGSWDRVPPEGFHRLTLLSVIEPRTYLELTPTSFDAHYRPCAPITFLRPRFASNVRKVVQEYSPVIHRLRLSASA